MTQISNIIKRIIDGFQNNHGRASCYCFDDEFIPEIIYNIIIPFVAKHKEPIFIATCNYEMRSKIRAYLVSKGIGEATGYSIRLLSADYIKPQYHYAYKLNIIVGVNNDYNLIKHLYDDSHFTLCILTKNIMDNNFISNVRAILPNIDIADTTVINRTARLNSPVEEHRWGVELIDKDRESYDKFTQIINNTLAVFGNLSNIEKSKKGDETNNISAAEFRTTLARNNGWNENLDTSIPFMKDIDDIYNPNILFERACNFYTIAKNRRDLIADNEAKFNTIYNICYANRDKRILIISKRGEYAAKITKYINETAEQRKDNLWCSDYHDCIDTCVDVDTNGDVKLIKSGKDKGKPRLLGWQAQSTRNEKLFNAGVINVLSIKSASNPKLKIACDVVIFTSPLCDDINATKSRFVNVNFEGVPLQTHVIYCNNTAENDILNRTKEKPTIKVINETENNFIGYDENSGDIIL